MLRQKRKRETFSLETHVVVDGEDTSYSLESFIKVQQQWCFFSLLCIAIRRQFASKYKFECSDLAYFISFWDRSNLVGVKLEALVQREVVEMKRFFCTSNMGKSWDVEELWLQEGKFLHLKPGVTMGTFGSILAHIGDSLGPHRGGRYLMEWDGKRQRSPWLLADATVTQLLVYLVREYTITSGSDDILDRNCIWIAVPWLIGHLYGCEGISWMLFVMHEAMRPSGTTAPLCMSPLHWAVIALAGKLNHCIMKEWVHAIEVSTSPVPVEPRAHLAIRDALGMVLPDVLIQEINSYHALDWITALDSKKEQEDVSFLALCEQLRNRPQPPAVPRGIDFKNFDPSQYMVQMQLFMKEQNEEWDNGDYNVKVFHYVERYAIDLPAIPNAELCAWEHLYLRPRVKCNPRISFGTILAACVEREHVQEWNRNRAALNEVCDACIPPLLQDTSCTALLCYYANYFGSMDPSPTHDVKDHVAYAFPHVMSYLYNVTSIQWMLFVVYHIQQTHRDLGKKFVNLRWWVETALEKGIYVERLDAPDDRNDLVLIRIMDQLRALEASMEGGAP